MERRWATPAFHGWPRKDASQGGQLHSDAALPAQGVSRVHPAGLHGHALSSITGFGNVFLHPTLWTEGSGGNALQFIGCVATSRN